MLAALAQEPASNFYVTGGVGPALTQDTKIKEFFGPSSGAKVEFDTGMRFSVAGGYQFKDWLAAEIETGFLFNSVERVSGTSDADFTVSHVPLLCNVVFQCAHTAPFVPFAGVGVGFAASVIDIDSFTLGGSRVTGTESDIVYAYQAFIGVRYEFNERMGVGLTYKYLGMGEPDWEASIGPAGSIRFDRIDSHALIVAFTYKF
jgi:opacity protein-like surface antigen